MENDTDTMMDVYLTRDQREAYERLRKDAERYRWLREKNPMALLAAAWGLSKEACAIGDDPDAAIDAAINGANA